MPTLVRIAEAEPLLADRCAAWLADRPQDAAAFPADPGDVVDDVLAEAWQDDGGQPLHPVTYSVGGYHGPILPGGSRADVLPAVLAKLGDRGAAVAAAHGEVPEIVHAAEHEWVGAAGAGAAAAGLLRARRRRRGPRVRMPARIGRR